MGRDSRGDPISLSFAAPGIVMQPHAHGAWQGAPHAAVCCMTPNGAAAALLTTHHTLYEVYRRVDGYGLALPVAAKDRVDLYRSTLVLILHPMTSAGG